jgi:hypothetical protein
VDRGRVYHRELSGYEERIENLTMDLAKLAAWRAALIREAERLIADPSWEQDEAARKRLNWLEFQVEMIDDRIRETVGSTD